MKWRHRIAIVVSVIIVTVGSRIMKRFGATKKKANANSDILHLNLDVRIQIASDLHLEFYGSSDAIPDDIIEPRAPILALLGDVGLTYTDLLKDFLLLQSDRFEQVFFVAGNHEFYNKHPQKKYSVQEQLEWIKNVCSERDNLHFLEQKAVDIQGVRILGTSLWSYVPPEAVKEAEATLNDYHVSYITDEKTGKLQLMNAAFSNAWHQQSLQWLEQQIQQAEKDKVPVVVLTHHTPSLLGTSKPEYDGSLASHCFSSDLTRLLQDPVKVWACGHTHYNFDTLFGETRLVSNQRGYPGRETMGYDSEGIVVRITPPGNKR